MGFQETFDQVDKQNHRYAALSANIHIDKEANDTKDGERQELDDIGRSQCRFIHLGTDFFFQLTLNAFRFFLRIL